MGLFDQFPYLQTQELNLDWLMRSMKELQSIYGNLKKEIQETIDFVNNFEEHADELINERIQVQMSIYLQRLMAVEAQIRALEEELNKDDGILGMVHGLQDSVRDLQRQINDLHHLLNDKILSIYELLHQYKHEISNYVDSKVQLLEQYIKDEVTKVDRLDVINPINGLFEPIQKVLDEMYAVISRSYGLTAAQYDSLKMAARMYDTYRISAYDYDTKGFFELYYKLTYGLMLSPFTGKAATISSVVNELANLHKCAMTAIEYDDMYMTAAEYDMMQLTAFAYDWWGYRIARPITAYRYDELQLTAEKYDKKKITAEMYSRGMRALLETELSGCNAPCGDYQILARQISLLQTQMDALGSNGAGVTYGLTTPVGQTQSTLESPIIGENTLVTVNARRDVHPDSIVVDKVNHKVTVTWNPLVTAVEAVDFTVFIENKERSPVGPFPAPEPTTITVGTGITYTMNLPKGETQSYLISEAIEEGSRIVINCDKNVKPLDVSVSTLSHSIIIKWSESATEDGDLSFTVAIQNKN